MNVKISITSFYNINVVYNLTIKFVNKIVNKSFRFKRLSSKPSDTLTSIIIAKIIITSFYPFMINLYSFIRKAIFRFQSHLNSIRW